MPTPTTEITIRPAYADDHEALQRLAALDSAHMMIYELMVQALLNEDRETAVQALMLDPLTAAVCSLTEVRQMFDEMAATQYAYLPPFVNPT